MARRRALLISDSDEAFSLEYLANGFNGSRAYQKVHPRAKQRTAEVEASKLLRKPEIVAYIDKEKAERKRRLQMDGDEALEAITRIARGDMRRLFTPEGRLLPVSQWPDDIADCVKAVKPTPFGTAIILYDKLKARELMAINGGKIRQKHEHTHKFDHAAYLGAAPPEGDDDDD